MNLLDVGDEPYLPKFFGCKNHDDTAVVHILPSASVYTFAEYAD